MIAQATNEKQPPKIDRFVIYGDHSAIVESKNGTAYAMEFFERQGTVMAPHCDCPFVPNAKHSACRHRRKLRSLLLAPARIEKYFGPCEIIDDAETPVNMETECEACGEFIVDCFVRVKPKGYYYGGQLHLAVCGCGVKYGAAFMAKEATQ